jgi:hypothetical protein
MGNTCQCIDNNRENAEVNISSIQNDINAEEQAIHEQKIAEVSVKPSAAPVGNSRIVGNQIDFEQKQYVEETSLNEVSLSVLK